MALYQTDRRSASHEHQKCRDRAEVPGILENAREIQHDLSCLQGKEMISLCKTDMPLELLKSIVGHSAGMILINSDEQAFQL